MTTANTETLWVGEPFEWNATLTTTITPRKITTQTPTTIGTIGSHGGVIHNISLVPLGVNVATVFRLYRKVNTNYKLILEKSLAAITSESEAAELTAIECTLPSISTASNTRALDCQGTSEYYVALGTAVSAGYEVWIRGGNY